MQQSKHYSAHLFYEKAEVKTKMLQVIQDFAFAKKYEFLKIGKLSSSATQKQSNYKLATEVDSEVEHGFVQFSALQSYSKVHFLKS